MYAPQADLKVGTTFCPYELALLFGYVPSCWISRNAFSLPHSPDDGVGHRFGGKRADARDVSVFGLPGCERENGIAVTHRVRRINRARESIVRHLRHLRRLHLRQPRIGCDDANRRVLRWFDSCAA